MGLNVRTSKVERRGSKVKGQKSKVEGRGAMFIIQNSYYDDERQPFTKWDNFEFIYLIFSV